MIYSKIWYKLTITRGDNSEFISEMEDIISTLLTELGSPGTELTATSVIGYFPSRENVELAKQEIEKKYYYFNQNAVSSIPFSYEISEVKEQDWKTEWKKFFAPIHISPQFTVVQPWGEYQSRKKEIVITINPQQAFGTGLHESTRLLLHLIEKQIQPDSTLLDVGCGTGIASIVAAKLNACSVTAIDSDEEAVKSARWHMRKNNVAHIVKVKKRDIREFEGKQYDIVAANIEWKILSHLVNILPKFMKPDGKLLISGITTAEKEALQDALKRSGLQWGRTYHKGEWVSLMAKLKK